MEPPESVLIYSKGEGIGDGIIKLPFVQALRERFADARITWLAGVGGSVYATTLKPAVAPLIDEVLVNANVGVSPWELLARGRPLPGRAFDLIVDTQRTVYRSLILRRIPHKLFVSSTARFLLSDVKPGTGFKRPPAMVRQLLALLDLVRPGPAEWRPVTLVGGEFREAAAALLPSGPTYVGLAPGAGNKDKCWPLERFVAVARDQAGKGRVPVIFLGPDEGEWLAELRAALPPQALFPEWDRSDPHGGTKGPLLVVALAERLAAAVANDCGTGHMLAAGGAPLVSLFGPSDPRKFAPVAPRLEVLTARQFGGDRTEKIPVDAVIAVLDKQVSRQDPEPRTDVQ